MPSSLAEAIPASDVFSAPLAYEQLLERCLGNVEFAQRILSKFVQKFAEDFERLEASVAASDVEAATLTAHRLKGSAANVAAPELARLLAEIEELGRDGDWSDVAGHIESLRAEWARFADFASSLAKG